MKTFTTPRFLAALALCGVALTGCGSPYDSGARAGSGALIGGAGGAAIGALAGGGTGAAIGPLPEQAQVRQLVQRQRPTAHATDIEL